MQKVRESYDKLGISVTDDMLLVNATKINKNPKLETSKGAELGALASVDFDSEKQVNKDSVEIEIDSVADIMNEKREKTHFETPNNNLRNSIAAPTIAADNMKSAVQNVNAGASDKDIQEMSDEDFSDDEDDGQTNNDKTAPTKKS